MIDLSFDVLSLTLHIAPTDCEYQCRVGYGGSSLLHSHRRYPLFGSLQYLVQQGDKARR